MKVYTGMKQAESLIV